MVELHLRVAPHGVVLRQAGLHVRHYLWVDGKSGGDIKALSSVSGLVKSISLLLEILCFTALRGLLSLLSLLSIINI